ncbi:FkbM family methyltransferase [Sphingomonas sp.]|uniref:FkbM family methyltransferase n=1 Tax=Sphingomonas sp. TaxID=28214 RepID=UPI003CC65F4F
MPTLKHTLAKLIARTRPTLFYYRAPAERRRGIRVRKIGDRLEVIRDETRQIVRIGAGNAVHLPDMIESFDYYAASADPVAIRQGDAIYALTDFSTPRLHHVSGFDDFAVLCPSSTEPFSTTAQYLDFAAIRPGSVVIDLGAYSGLTAIAFSKAAGPTGRVIALEPDPMNFRAAAYNLATHARVNGLDNITLLPWAASDADGQMAMSSEGTMGSALVSIVGGYRGATVSVEARTLDSIARHHELAAVDFVKIDIEGAEEMVVRASSAFLAKYRPRLLIEGHLVNGVSTIPPITAFLEANGYACEVVSQEGLTFSLVQARPV